METKVTFNVLDVIEKIHLHAKDCQLSSAFLDALEPELQLLCDYLKVERLPAVLFAAAFVQWFDSGSFTKVFKEFGLSNFQLLKYRTSIETLYQRNLLINKAARKKQLTSYDLSQSVINSVSKSEPLKIAPQTIAFEERNLVDLLEEFDGMSDQLDVGDIHLCDFTEYIETLCNENLEMPLFREIKNYKLDPFETFFFLDTIWDAINCGDNDFNTSIEVTVSEYFSTKSHALHNIQKLINKETKLSKLDLIEISNESMANKSRAKLSRKITDFLREHHDVKIDEISGGHSSLIRARDIKPKELHFNRQERQHLTQLTAVLEEKKFTDIQRLLAEKAMPLGVTAIFHGVPGTGKTESVYQLARSSGRNIFKVDISETKSMWFGESQKLVKNIFKTYQQCQKSEALCPILLFNEADAVIGKRKAAGSSSVADTENAIQNIILEELENFDGILFATTNLIDNLDAAFERRFLFKVRFERPDAENATRIWQSKLPLLSTEEAGELAVQFDFSGGEMENIARKCAMHELLNSGQVGFAQVRDFCAEEKWSGAGDKAKIGF